MGRVLRAIRRPQLAGLVDELNLMVGATLAWRGHAGVRRRDGSDNVLLRYEVVNRDE